MSQQQMKRPGRPAQVGAGLSTKKASIRVPQILGVVENIEQTVQDNKEQARKRKQKRETRGCGCGGNW